MIKILSVTILVFLSVFVYQALSNMRTVPFHDFDEAHRAEQAKRMREYLSFLLPLSGSPQDRTSDLKVPFNGNRNLFLYYHPERPPFVYWLIMTSTSIFGTDEWAYRLPSLLMALATILIFILFIVYGKKFHPLALLIGLVTLLTSADLWLSGQYVQLDTTLTFFMSLSLFSLIFHLENKKNILLVISGLSLSLAVLSKGQPAAVILFPLIYLLASKRLSIKTFLKFCLYSAIILLPWLFLLNAYFGIGKIVGIFAGFTAYSAIAEYSFIKAPIFWYLRWWWDSLRPGFILFSALLIFDLIHRDFNWKKLTILSYILGGLALFSLSVNKIWWYVLPLIPAVAFYIYLSSQDYLERRKTGLVNISLIILLVSAPFFYAKTNTITLLYGVATTLIGVLILSIKETKFSPQFRGGLFCLSLFTCLIFFYYHFPTIVPYHHNTKFVAQYFKSLPGIKCLLVRDMPPEAALFYSDAGEIIPLSENRTLFPNCENYLITPEDIRADQITYTLNEQTFKLKEKSILFQKGTMKLIKL